MRAALLIAALSWEAAATEPTDPGADVYAARCATCHGATGRGDGPAAKALPRPPTDLTSPAFWEAATDASLRTTILQGKPGTAMRAYPMAEDKLVPLVTYLRTFKPAP